MTRQNSDHRAYLDHNATTPLHPAARAAILAACDNPGNPSSVHAEGRRARALLEDARAAVAALVGGTPDQLIFTSGGTEALNIVLTPHLTRDGRGHDVLLIGGGEHPAVFAGHRFGDRASPLALTREGQLDLDALETALRKQAGAPVMLALQAANNETGVIQPVAEAAALVHRHNGFVVCDAVQAVGKIDCSLAALGADALVLSAHKFGGPKGVGALCFGPSRHHLMQGVVRGGGQERGLRAGTENVLGIAGLGAACGPARDRVANATLLWASWRDEIEASILAVAPEAVIFGRGAPRLPNTVSFAIPGVAGQTMLMNLDLEGVAVSAGSACASGKVKPSHVLAAMGVGSDLAANALRVSLGWTTQAGDIDRFKAAFAKVVARMRPRVAA